MTVTAVASPDPDPSGVRRALLQRLANDLAAIRALTTGPPMTHLERLIVLLDDAGYRCVEENPGGIPGQCTSSKEYMIREPDDNDRFNLSGCHSVVMFAEDYGYIGHYPEFFFDADGNLIGHAAWE